MFYLILVICLILIAISIYLFWKQKKQNDLAFQLDLIIKKQSSSLLKPEGCVLTPSLIDSINSLIKEFTKEKKEFEAYKKNYRDIVTSISHDFRTPLTSTSGYVQMLIDNPALTEEERLKYLHIIKDRSRSLSYLIEDFYTLTSLDSFDYPFHIEAVALDQSLKEIVANYYIEIEKSFSSVSIDIEEAPSIIQADRVSLERIFSNLIKNSFLYGKGSFQLSAKQEARKYCVCLSNTTQSTISPSLQETLFERNFSVDWISGATSTGLGLSIAKSLTEKFHGHLQAKIDGNTIQFIVTFPLIPPKINP